MKHIINCRAFAEYVPRASPSDSIKHCRMLDQTVGRKRERRPGTESVKDPDSSDRGHAAWRFLLYRINPDIERPRNQPVVRSKDNALHPLSRQGQMSVGVVPLSCEIK
ncbi:hypothetical protein Bbelb_184310 [Branchiostoma belcheri]|nr:hypothetical protein Bbelb_184310 [Branchiostoma belcheri]